MRAACVPLALVLGASTGARADLDVPNFGDIAFCAGGNLGITARGKRSLGAEITLRTSLKETGPSFSLGTVEFDDRRYHYAEVAIWYWVSVGIGAGLQSGGETLGASGHLFLGLPIPLRWTPGITTVPYIEPYVRPQLALSAGARHVIEAGLLLKMSVALGQE